MSHTWTHLPQSGLSRSASFLLTDVDRLAAGKRQLTCQTLLTAIELIKQRLCKGEKSDWGKWGCWPGAGNITLVCVSKCRTYAYHGTGKYDRRKLYCMGILCGQTDARRSIQHSDVFCDSVLQRNMSKSLMWQFLVPLRLHSPSLRVTLAILWAGLPRIGAFPFFAVKNGIIPPSFCHSLLSEALATWCARPCARLRVKSQRGRSDCTGVVLERTESQMFLKCSDANAIET